MLHHVEPAAAARRPKEIGVRRQQFCHRMHVAAHQRAVDEKAVGGHLEAVIARSVSDKAIHTSLPPRGSMDCFAFARSDADDIVVIPVAIYGRLIYREPRSARRFERQQEWIPPPLQDRKSVV